MTEEDLLVDVFLRLDTSGRGAINAEDVALGFRSVGVSVSKSKVADLVWEADGDADGLLTLADVEDMYYRAPDVDPEVAPTRLLNLIEFLMYDPSSSGYISVEDAMHVMYRRFRDSVSPALLKKFLLDTQINPSKRISFRDFLRQIKLRQTLVASRA